MSSTFWNPSDPDADGPDAPTPDTDTAPPDPSQTDAGDQLIPSCMRVVDLESEAAGAVLRFDCYEQAPGSPLVRRSDGEVQVYAVKWAHQADPDATVEIGWTGTGLAPDEVDRVRIYPWPVGSMLRSYREVE